MIIEITNLVKHYGDIKAVDGISFQVEEGEIFGMLGPNGAGKTTTVEIIEGLRVADSGQVRVMGLDVLKAGNKIKQKIGIQLQTPSLLPLLNVEEVLDTFAGFYRHHLTVDAMLELLALEESRKVVVKNLSGGQQQRLSVAMALINDPDIVFFDEPTSGLDPQARRGLWSVIEGMQAKGKTVFLTTHFMEEAERLCDRVAIMDHGKIIALGSPAELIREHFQEKAIEFEVEQPPPQAVLRGLPGATRVDIDAGEVVLHSDNIPATMSALLKYAENGEPSAQIKDLRVREASLEDVFLKLTGRKIRD